MKRELFRDPRGGRWPWVLLLFGCAWIVSGLFFYEPGGATPAVFYMALGLMFVFWGAAEVLAKGRTLTAWLRVGQCMAGACSLIVMVVHFSSRAF